MKKNIFLSGILTIPIIISGSLSTKPATGVPDSSEMLYQYQWNLEELNGQSISKPTKAHLLFSRGQVNSVSGNAGCNSLRGTFELTGVNFMNFSPLATTKMACPGDNPEAKFLEALGQVNNWSIINNELLLSNGRILVSKLRGATPSQKSETPPSASTLSGDWELNYISGKRIAFEGLYPDKKPQIKFNLSANELGGNTSCNGFSSKLTIVGNKINISEPFAKTMIFCEGEGESSFLDMLKKVNKYDINGNTLTFMIDDVAVMRFVRN